jgi:hypothetical protein
MPATRLCGAVLNLEITAIVQNLMPLFFHQKQKKETEEYQKGLKRPRHHGNFILDVVLRANVTGTVMATSPMAEKSHDGYMCILWQNTIFYIRIFRTF